MHAQHASDFTNGWSMNDGKSFEMVDVIRSPLSPPEVNSYQVRCESEELYARDSQTGWESGDFKRRLHTSECGLENLNALV